VRQARGAKKQNLDAVHEALKHPPETK